jgi:hypothetical protein
MGVDYRTFQSAGRISQHAIPGAYSRIDSVQGAAGFVSATNLVIMGKSRGGEPQTLLQFNNVNAAINTLRGGELMDAIRLAFNPGNNLVPQRIYAMRVNNATQASVNLEDGSSNAMATIRSRDYGAYTNQIQFTLADGTNEGKKVTVVLKNDTEVFDDINRPSLQITHSTESITITINDTTQELSDTGTLGTLDLNNYDTIGDLASYINAQSGYTAVAVAGQEEASPLELDSVSSVAVSGGVTFSSNLEAIADTINSSSLLVEVELVFGSNDRAEPQNLAATYLTGGTEGDYDATQWTAALSALEAEDVNFVSTPDTDTSVHNSIKNHCTTMSSVTGRKERQFVVGHGWGTTISTAISEAKILNSKWGATVFNGGYQFDLNGNKTAYHAGYAACMFAAMKTVLAINEPQTFKTVNFIELEQKVTDSDKEQLIRGGVAPIAYNSNGIPHVVRSVTNYQTADLKWNEFSMVTEMAFVSRDLRNFLETQFVGKAGTNIAGGVLEGSVKSRLSQYTELGVFIRDDSGTAWWNVQIVIVGDSVEVDYDAYLTAPVNFIFVTNHFHELVQA